MKKSDEENNSRQQAPNPARIAFLRQGSTPSLEPTCPPLIHRWLHSDEKLWKAFNVLDSRNLDKAQEQWEKEKQLKGAAQENEKDTTKSGTKKETEEDYGYSEPDPSKDLESWRVPVLEDKMWEVDLRRNKLCSVFWKTEESSIMRASWFYESSTKLLPASQSLAEEIESLYQEIQPWTSSYCDELKSSLSLGAEGEKKLKCELKSLKGSYVIFIGRFLARIYSENFSSRLSKTILTAFSGEHGGGSLLIRGFDNNDRFLKTRNGEKDPSGTSSNVGGSPSGGKRHGRSVSTSSNSSLNPSIATSSSASTSTPTNTSSSSYESLTKRLSAQLGRAVKDPPSSRLSSSSSSSKLDSQFKSDSRRDSVSSEKGTGATTPTKPSSPSSNDRDGAESPLPIGAAEPDQQTKRTEKKSRTASSGSLPPPQPVGASSDLFKTLTSKFNVWGLGGGSAFGSSDEGQIGANDEPNSSKAKKIAKDAMGSDSPNLGSEAELEDEDEDLEETEEEELKRELENQEQPVEIILCLHGMGQRLASMPGWGNLDFTLAINAFRILVQNRSKSQPPAEIGGDGFKAIMNGRRVQFIPVMWRKTLEDFKPTNGEEDEDEEESNYNKNEFDLKDILGESDSIPLVKSLIEGVLLDIPLYLSQYKGLILKKVKGECNRLYRLFLQRNPNFLKNQGKVSILSHSLGTALAVDILSHQPTFVDEPFPKRESKISQNILEFDCKALIMCGSPVALFLWLNQAPLISRRGRECTSQETGNEKEIEEKISLDKVGKYGCLAVNRVANIFFTSDPIATRLNSTVDSRLSKSMKALDVKKAVHTVLRCLPGANKDVNLSESSPSISSGARLFGTWNKFTSDGIPSVSDGEGEDGLRLDGAEGLFGKDDLQSENEDGKNDADSHDDGWISKLTPRKGKYANRPSTASKAEDKKLKKEWEEIQKPSDGDDEEEDDDDREKKTSGHKIDRSSTPTQDSTDKSSTIKGKGKDESEEERKKKKKAYDESKEKEIAQRKFNALNPLGVIDFSIPVAPSLISHQYMSYISMLFSHAGYWNNSEFADFVLSMLFASDEQLAEARKKGNWK